MQPQNRQEMPCAGHRAIIKSATRAAHTPPKLQCVSGRPGFEVQSVRGHLEDKAVAYFQVTLKVGFRLEDA